MLGIVLYFANKFLFLALSKNIGDQLEKDEIKEAEEFKLDELKGQDIDEKQKKSALVNSYLNWLTILRSTIKTYRHEM